MLRLTDIMDRGLDISYVMFSPANDHPLQPLQETMDRLQRYQPGFFSCTYGSLGQQIGQNLAVCKHVADDPRPAVALTHFSCIGNSREQVKQQLQTYLDNGIYHILALRGDLHEGCDGTGGDFNYASDLVKFIRKEFGDKFTIAVAGNPEGHPECRSLTADIAHLRQKQEEGADFIMTQTTQDHEQFLRWQDMLDRAGIWMPIHAGVMPVLNKEAVIRMCLPMNGIAVPPQLSRLISRYYNDAEGFAAAGMEYTVDQMLRYAAAGVAGIHLYTCNRWQEVSQIVDMTGLRAGIE